MFILYSAAEFEVLARANGYGENVYNGCKGTLEEFIEEHNYKQCSVCEKWGIYSEDVFKFYSPDKTDRLYCLKCYSKLAQKFKDEK